MLYNIIIMYAIGFLFSTRLGICMYLCKNFPLNLLLLSSFHKVSNLLPRKQQKFSRQLETLIFFKVLSLGIDTYFPIVVPTLKAFLERFFGNIIQLQFSSHDLHIVSETCQERGEYENVYLKENLKKCYFFQVILEKLKRDNRTMQLTYNC